MNPNDINALMLESVARRLGDDLLGELVFVGGAVAGLLITDPAMPAIRPTEDVGLLVQALTLADYHRVEKALAALGFTHDMAPDAPICRWRVGGVPVDVMPALEEILGFSNPWYPLALETAEPQALPGGTLIRLVAAPVFLATKLEAFSGRGNSDYLFSHDLGDFLAVIDGRAAPTCGRICAGGLPACSPRRHLSTPCRGICRETRPARHACPTLKTNCVRWHVWSKT